MGMKGSGFNRKTAFDERFFEVVGKLFHSDRRVTHSQPQNAATPETADAVEGHFDGRDRQPIECLFQTVLLRLADRSKKRQRQMKIVCRYPSAARYAFGQCGQCPAIRHCRP